MRRVLLLVLGLSAAVWAVNGNMGVGTEPLTNGSAAYPWLIEDLADFDAFAGNSAYWAAGVHTKLMTDIDLSGRTYTTAVIASLSTNSFFNGVFHGNNYAIFNLTITEPEEDVIGLFGLVQTDGLIRDLGVENVNITGDSYVGGLIGYNAGSLSGCYAIGSVRGKWFVGVLVGYNSIGMLTSCYAVGSAGGINEYCSDVGGLVGLNGGCLSSCYADSSVSGNRSVGGLAGRSSGMIVSCNATSLVSGMVRSDGQFAGGLVGYNCGSLLSCYATGSVSGDYFVGGLVGTNISEYPEYPEKGSITNCYATGLVSGDRYSIGGLAGENYGGSITACFWDTQTSGLNVGVGDGSATGTIGKFTQEMMTQTTFTGWDFSTPIWMMLREGEDYPRLAWQETYLGDVAGLYGVDMVDFAYLANYWGMEGCNDGTDCGRADIDGSGDVGVGDLAAVAEDWLR